MSQFVLGIGNTLYYSLGQSYLDDNTKQRNTPLMLAYAFSMRMFGPILGFGLAYSMLDIYIDPRYTPLITSNVRMFSKKPILVNTKYLFQLIFRIHDGWGHIGLDGTFLVH